jgi:hypothetical protein
MHLLYRSTTHSFFILYHGICPVDVVLCVWCRWLTTTTFISNMCLTQFKTSHPLINLLLTNGALSILSQHTMVNFHRFLLLLPKETALRHVVLRWCNVAKECPCFRPRCCHSAEGRAMYCKWLNTSTGTVNSAQCTSSFLSRLPHNLKTAFTFRFTYVSQKSAHLIWWFGNEGLGLALHSLVQSNPVWKGLVQHFKCKIKIISHI